MKMKLFSMKLKDVGQQKHIWFSSLFLYLAQGCSPGLEKYVTITYVLVNVGPYKVGMYTKSLGA